MQRFGEKLRTLRDRRGISLRELAKELAFRSHAHLARVEKGEKTPNAELILKIAYFFDVATDVLMKDELELREDWSSTMRAVTLDMPTDMYQQLTAQASRLGKLPQVMALEWLSTRFTKD